MKYDILYPYREYLNSKFCKNTANKYYSSIKNALKDIDFNSLQDIPENYIESKLQAARTKNNFSALKNGFKNLQEFDPSLQLPEEAAMKEMASHKRNRVKSRGKKVDVDTISRTVNAGRDPKLKYACRLSMISGLRVAELADLEPADIIFNDDRTIQVNVKNGKGGRSWVSKCLQDFYLYDKLYDFVKDAPADQKLFYSESHMRKYAWEHNMEMHDFRRIFANLLKKELQEAQKTKQEIKDEVQHRLGHARFSNTKRYLYGRKVIIKARVQQKYGNSDPGITIDPETIKFEDMDRNEFYDILSDLDAYGISAKEEDTIIQYTNDLYKNINKALYAGTNLSEHEEQIRTMEECINKKRIPDDMILYRSINDRSILFGNDHHLKPEELNEKFSKIPFIHKSFLSGSVSIGNTLPFIGDPDRGIIMRIHVPTGTKGIYVGAISERAEEQEVILQRGSVLRFKEIWNEHGYLIADMDLEYQFERRL